MATLEENRVYWKTYGWEQGGDEWSVGWGDSKRMFWGSIFPRILDFLPAGTVLEIAPGFGRVTQFLKEYAERLILVDLAPRCIEACRERFHAEEHITCHVNDGKSLPMVANAEVDFAFSFDSLVHVEAEVLKSYINELARTLAAEGVAFLHHSNLGAFRDQETGKLSIENTHWRSESMSSQLLREYCDQVGLQCIVQEQVNWGQAELTDCFSVVTRPGSKYSRPLRIWMNSRFKEEVAFLGAMCHLYGFSGTTEKAEEADG